MKRINAKKYINKIGKKIFKAMYNKFMRVGDPRGELSMFEVQSRISFYISIIMIIALFAFIIFFIILLIYLKEIFF
tara:strand:+ start:220 stop:447 length:228 start_codon:yes stop_codon:yes gene_type:complete